MTGSASAPAAGAGPSPSPGDARWFARLPNWIGDAVLAVPALRSLPRRGVRWWAAAHPRALPLYEALGIFERVLPAHGASAPVRLASAVRGFAPDGALVFTEAFSGRLLARLSGARRRIERPRGGGEAARGEPLWRQYAALAARAGGAVPETPDFRIDVGAERRERVRRLLGDAGPCVVAIAPGAAYGPAKRWPTERYRALAERLRDRGWATVALGGSADRDAAAELEGGGALNLAGRLDLLEAVAAYGLAAVAVTNDSGALHLARAAGTPVVAIFGSSSPTWTGPLPAEGVALWKNPGCSPCFRRECPLDGDARLRCLRDIGVDEVLAAVDAAVGEATR